MELVDTSEYNTYNLWLKVLLKEHRYEIKDNVVFQDNKSAILTDKNGRNSCIGKSRDINVRYFFVKDRRDKSEVRVKCCPNHLMLEDFY